MIGSQRHLWPSTTFVLLESWSSFIDRLSLRISSELTTMTATMQLNSTLAVILFQTASTAPWNGRTFHCSLVTGAADLDQLSLQRKQITFESRGVHLRTPNNVFVHDFHVCAVKRFKERLNDRQWRGRSHAVRTVTQQCMCVATLPQRTLVDLEIPLDRR
jgi:hypothetical protein